MSTVPRVLCAALVLHAHVVLVSAVHSYTWRLSHNFLTAAVSELYAHGESGALILDIGANDGYWSDAAMRLFSTTNRPLELVMFEPNRVFAPRLASLARTWNGTFLPVAAWTANTTLQFRQSEQSETASVHNDTVAERAQRV